MLAHPLIVEAIEDNFVPVAVYNNVGGDDQKILKRFEEPAWNYQVMRFMNSEAVDIVPRRDKVWTVPATAARLVEALEAADKPVPGYLSNILLAETNPQRKTIVLAMHCFWVGEAKLGMLDGVLTTQSGFYDRREVVKVTYDPAKITLQKLIGEAEKLECANGVYLANEADRKTAASVAKHSVKDFDSTKYRIAAASDQKRQLQGKGALTKLILTPMQWTKINSVVGHGRFDQLEKWLTPRQLKSVRPQQGLRP